MKICLGTMEIANQMHTFTHAYRRRGLTALGISYYPNYLGFDADVEYAAAAEPDPAVRRAVTGRIAERAIAEFDLFHFWFNTTLTLDYRDLPVLAARGKRLIMQHCGSDVRTLEVARRLSPYARCKPVPPARIKARLAVVTRHIDTCIVGSMPAIEFVKDHYRTVHMVPVALELDRYPVATENLLNPRPLVVHAPTSRDFKGSDDIIAAVRRLEARLDFDFVLVEGMPHDQAKAIYRRADVVVDQIRAGNYGSLAIECMAMGKTVVVWIGDYARSTYPEEVPVISANPETIEAQLEVAICDADLRRSLGARARRYVERYHDSERIAESMLKIYRGEGVDDAPVQVWWTPG